MSTATVSTVTVTVTREHIDQGEQRSCSNCPIALAFDAAIPDALDSSVTGGYASVWTDLRRVVTYELPIEAREFIQDFDEGSPVSPFTFEAEELPS